MPSDSYTALLERLREVFALYRASPGMLVNSLELEDRTRDVARAALGDRLAFPALCAELGRVAHESLASDRLTAIAVGQAMSRWASRAYVERAR